MMKQWMGKTVTVIFAAGWLIGCGDTKPGADGDADSDTDTDTETAPDGGPDGGLDAGADDGPIWDPATAVCDNHRDYGAIDPWSGVDDPWYPGAFWCDAHEQCTGGVNGRCSDNGGDPWLDGDGTYECSYDRCFSHADCKGGGPCICGGDVQANRCYPGNCTADADCGADGVCAPSTDECNYGTTGYYCRTPEDTCLGDGDCEASGEGDVCYFEPLLGYRTCADTSGCMVIG